MKKFGKILLSITLICTLLIVFAVPVFADEYDPSAYDYRIETKGDEYYFYVNNGKGLKTVLEEFSNSSSTVHIVLNAFNTDTEPIEISKGGNIYFETTFAEDEVKIRCNNEKKPLFTITAANTLLSFETKNIVIKSQNKTKDGGAIYVDADDCIINGGHFRDCYSGDTGGAICVNKDNCIVWGCLFEHCVGRYNGGGVFFCRGADEGIVGDCSFYDCDCGSDLLREAAINVTGNGDTLVGGYFTNTEPSLAECVLIEDKNEWRKLADAYWQMRANREKKEPKVTEYKRPVISNYAQNAITNNKQCDVIRPDLLDTVESDNEHFTLEGKNAYGALWEVDWQNALTIKAKDGYTITRIEAVVTNTNKENYNALSIDNGTKGDLIKNDNSLEADSIAHFDDINAKSVTLTTKGNNTDWGTVYFREFVIYYTQDTTLGSVFSGGTLWIIIGVVVVAAVAAVVIILFVNKKKKSLASNDAVVEKTDKEDE